MTDPLVAALTAAVGPDHVLLDADVRAGYEVDWLNQWGAPSRCVVRPGSAEEVAAVVRSCVQPRRRRIRHEVVWPGKSVLHAFSL